MNIHNATEEAYKNGYKNGYKAGVEAFAERLKEKATSAFFDEREYVDTVDIDNLLKEMTEEV